MRIKKVLSFEDLRKLPEGSLVRVVDSDVDSLSIRFIALKTEDPATREVSLIEKNKLDDSLVRYNLRGANEAIFRDGKIVINCKDIYSGHIHKGDADYEKYSEQLLEVVQ